jgi:hypothetical protein
MTRPKAQTLRQGHGSTVPEFRQNPEPVVAPDPPKTLDAYGNRLWYELWQAGRNAYQPGTDFLVIERYCQLQSRRRQLLTIVEEEGKRRSCLCQDLRTTQGRPIRDMG